MVLTPLWGIGGQDIDFLCVAQKISLGVWTVWKVWKLCWGYTKKSRPWMGAGFKSKILLFRILDYHLICTLPSAKRSPVPSPTTT